MTNWEITLSDTNSTDAGVMTNRRKGNLEHPCQCTRKIVAADGVALRKLSLDTAWQRLMKLATDEGIITQEERFGLHDLKRLGITDTKKPPSMAVF